MGSFLNIISNRIFEVISLYFVNLPAMRSYYIFFELLLISIIIKDSATKYLLVEVEEENKGGRLSSKKEGESCGLGGARSDLPPMDHPPIGWGAMGRSLGEVFGICGPDLTCEPSKDEDKPGTCVKTAGRLSSKKEGESCGLGGARSGLPPMDHPPIGWGAMGQSLGEVFGECGPDLTCEPSKDEDKPGTCVKTANAREFSDVIEDLTKCVNEGEFCLGFGTNIKPCCDGLECKGFPIKKCEVPQVTEPELCKTRPNVCANLLFAQRCPITCA